MVRTLLTFTFLLALFLHPNLSPAAQNQENCTDEVCDGLDNDCDKAIDDFADCGPNLQCGCAHCNKEAVNGKCEAGVLWDGFCLEDFCPPGLACDFKSGKCRRR